MKKDSINESSLKRRHQEATRQAILEAAEAQLAERGLHGTRMEDVAARAGVSVGTIYNHLGGRSTLLSELLSARRRELIARIDTRLDESKKHGFETQLAAYVQAVVDHFQSHLPLLRILVAEELAADAGAKRSLLAALVDRARSVLTRGIEQGAIPPHDAELYSLLLVGMLRGIFAGVVSDSLSPGVADRVVAFFLAGARAS